MIDEKTVEMAYITKYNSKRILRFNPNSASALDYDSHHKDSFLPGKSDLFSKDGKKQLLSELERKWLFCARVMYEDFRLYVEKIYDDKYKKEDTFTYSSPSQVV